MSDPKKRVFRFADILDDVIKAYEAEPMYSRCFGDTIIPFDGRLIDLPFNREYTAYLTCEQYARFKQFCISILSHQTSQRIHPLTCGVNSSHELLVPRITLSDYVHVLVCPTCGYVQPPNNFYN
jgi:hypothetical protein